MSLPECFRAPGGCLTAALIECAWRALHDQALRKSLVQNITTSHTSNTQCGTASRTHNHHPRHLTRQLSVWRSALHLKRASKPALSAAILVVGTEPSLPACLHCCSLRLGHPSRHAHSSIQTRQLPPSRVDAARPCCFCPTSRPLKQLPFAASASAHAHSADLESLSIPKLGRSFRDCDFTLAREASLLSATRLIHTSLIRNYHASQLRELGPRHDLTATCAAAFSTLLFTSQRPDEHTYCL